jgi:hypothetical protein
MATDSEIRQWAKDRGAPVSTRGRVSDELRAEYETARSPASPRLLPSPAEIAEDVGIIDVDDGALPGGAGSGRPAPPAPEPEPEVPGEDEPPPHARREWRKPRTRAKAKAAPKITASIRDDIAGKIGFGLEIPGRIWQARDPLCGGTFIEQLPAITESLTNWVLRSPQLVTWFTSPAGSGFMLLLDTAAAVGPVASVVMAHHVYHTVELAPEGEQPPQAQYAA